ncbi:hypothetical protein TELCIR_11874 [Teladorsagia circumcincta]|uniref:Uncharacterized protein n=1 Tax=Teladorsagia circumcincta TaxID=45464 RepID=A0A2G9U8B1_TELCI|nr:hypothetical protein TELCIR_11874 [Teladorsagia circumcincta]
MRHARASGSKLRSSFLRFRRVKMSVAVDEKDMNDVAEGGEKKLSKKELNKLAKAAKIAELKAQKASSQPKEEDAEDVSVGMYGSYGMIQSTDKKDIVFTKLSEIDATIHGKEVR